MKTEMDPLTYNRKCNRKIKGFQIHLVITIFLFIIMSMVGINEYKINPTFENVMIAVIMMTSVALPLVLHYISLFGWPGLENRLKEIYHSKNPSGIQYNETSNHFESDSDILEELLKNREKSNFDQNIISQNQVWKESDFV